MKVFVDVKLEKSTSKVYYENDNNYKPKPVYRMFVFTGRQRLTNNEYIFVFYYQDEFIYSPYGVFDGKTEKVVQNKVTDVVIRTKPKDFKGFGESVRDWETAAGSLWPNYYPKKQILRFYPKDDERFQRNFQSFRKADKAPAKRGACHRATFQTIQGKRWKSEALHNP